MAKQARHGVKIILPRTNAGARGGREERRGAGAQRRRGGKETQGRRDAEAQGGLKHRDAETRRRREDFLYGLLRLDAGLEGVGNHWVEFSGVRLLCRRFEKSDDLA